MTKMWPSARTTWMSVPYSAESTGAVITSSTVPSTGLAVAEIEHAVERAEQLVELVRAE